MSDDLDDLEFGDALRRLAGGIPDADAALPTLHRRVRVARIRRVSTIAASAAVVAVAATAIGLAAGGSDPRISPADADVTLPSDVNSTEPVSTDQEATVGSTPSETTPTGATGSSSGSGSGTAPGTGGRPQSGGTTGSTRPDSSISTTSIVPSGNDDDDHSDGSGGDRTTVPVTVSRRCSTDAGAFTAVYSGRVRASNIAPAAGFTVQRVEQQTESATVIFRMGETEVALVALWNGSLLTCSVET